MEFYMKKENTRKKSAPSAKQIAAIAGIILLVTLYIVTLVAAIIDSSVGARLFRACIGLTIAVPILLWIFIWAIGVMTHKKSIAEMDILNSNSEERAKMEEAVRRESAKHENSELSQKDN